MSRIECYPTVHGVPVSPLDIWLPETHLNPNKDKNYNNHHDCWTARRFGRSILFQVFRDLQSHQNYLPLDVHEWLHANYGPPAMPTPLEAMERIEQAYYECENLQIRKAGGYIIRLLDKSVFQQCDKNYNRLNWEI